MLIPRHISGAVLLKSHQTPIAPAPYSFQPYRPPFSILTLSVQINSLALDLPHQRSHRTQNLPQSSRTKSQDPHQSISSPPTQLPCHTTTKHHIHPTTSSTRRAPTTPSVSAPPAPTPLRSGCSARSHGGHVYPKLRRVLPLRMRGEVMRTV